MKSFIEQEQCPKCGEQKLVSKKVYLLAAGVVGIVIMPLLMLVSLITIIFSFLIPLWGILFPVFAGVGIILIIISPFVKGKICTKCKYREI